jgi:hypothetical protein
MISKAYIKALDFETIEDVYNYIVDSDINGNQSQFKELVQKLSRDQFIDFIRFIDDFVYHNENSEAQNNFKNKVITARGF